MKVRTKAFVIICMTFAILITVCVIFFQAVTYKRFVAIEQQLFATTVDRTLNTLAKEFDELEKIGGDWGIWDDTYTFIQDRNLDYIAGNLNFEALEILDVDAMIFLGLTGKIWFSKCYDLAEREEVLLPASIASVFQSGAFNAWFHDGADRHQGFLRDANGSIFMFTAVSIHDSAEELPAKGVFIVGRFVDPDHLQGLGRMLEIPIQLITLDRQGASPAIPARTLTELQHEGTLVQNISRDQARGFVLVKDIFNEPVAVLQMDLDRSISRQGHNAVVYVIAFFIVFGMVLLGVVLLILDTTVLRRLNAIIAEVRSIADDKDVSTRISVSGRDELARLGNNLNAMLASLEEEQRQRKAAEVERVILTSAIEQLQEDVVLMDPKGAIVYENPSFTNRASMIRGKEAGPVQGFEDLFDDFRQAERAKQAIASGSAWNEWCRRKQADGESMILDVMIAPVTDQAGDVVNTVCIRRDITEKVEIDKRLQLSRKMEALGSLAGGIAHDFNNILTSISGFTQLIGFDVARDSRSHTYLDQILLGVKRAKELIDQILTYSAHKDDPESAVPVRLSAIVDEALNLAKVSLPRNIVLHRKIAENVHPVLADSGQLHQIVINLCTNAGHAMKDGGGELRVIVRSATPEDYATYHLSPDTTGYVCLQVRDNGTGMSREVQERIFDPFFTTKDPGEGTGLGLPVVHSIVTRMGGIIHVSSESGKGSLFSLFFPEMTDEAIEMNEHVLENVEGKERILFVDDEEDVVYIAREMLEILGYDVTATTDSRQAWQYFKDNPEGYDIVVTDFSMQNLDGKELAERIFSVTDKVPVLLCSGYMPSLDSKKIVDKDLVMVLKKPYTSQELTRAMQQLLRSQSKERQA